MKRLLGLDIGERRIGLAVSDEGRHSASPLKVIDRLSDERAAEDIAAAAEEFDAEAIVYGLPISLSGEAGVQAEATRAFAHLVGEKTGKKMIPQDERLSSVEAEKLLIAEDVKRAQRKKVIDKMAAAIILQKYLDGQSG